MRSEGYDAKFSDTSPEALATSKPSYQFHLSADKMIGQFSVWTRGECDFDILDVETKELKPNLWGLLVNDENFQATFARFYSIVLAS